MKRWHLSFAGVFFGACGGGGGNAPHVVSGHGLPKTQPDRDSVRRIVLVYPYSHEKLDVVYFHDGAYDPGL